MRVRQGPGAPVVSSFRDGTSKAQEGREREAVSTARVEHSGEAEKPMRASARPDFGPGSGTDLRREQRPGAAGHHDLLVLRAGECDVRNGKRAQASKGVRLCGGEKLCRVNPTSGTDPRDRKAREGGNRQEGEKP